MFKSNILLALRSFRRNRSSFVINLIGLSTGLTCALLIYLWVDSESKVDKFHKLNDQLFTVVTNQFLGNEIQTWLSTPDLLADALTKEIPEIEMATSVMPAEEFGYFVLRPVNEDNIKAKGQFADPDFFNVFSFPLLYGDPGQVLQDKQSMVISEQLAYNLYESPEKAIGKTIEWQIIGYRFNAKVTGIFKSIPANSTHQFDFMLTHDAWLELSRAIDRNIHWDNYGPRTYIVVNENANIPELNDKIKNFLQTKNEKLTAELLAIPFSSLYLYGNFENGRQQAGRIQYVRIFSLVAVFILVIACINFMNLSTARASRRIKEIGVKKTIGANRRVLVMQFLGESIILSYVSLAVAIVLIMLFLPQFNFITGKQLSLSFSFPQLMLLLGISTFTGILAGSYPALYLSGFSPLLLFSFKSFKSGNELWFRKGLVVFQFTLSVILIIGVIIIYQQLEYIQNKNLGYKKDNLIYFDKEGEIAEKQEIFLERLKKIPGVVNASSSITNFMGTVSSTMGVSWPGKDPEQSFSFEVISGSSGVLETMQIPIKEGRSFSENYDHEQDKIIFNQAAIDLMDLEQPIGTTVSFWGEQKQIIGVVENFHFESFYELIRPAVFIVIPQNTLHILVRIEAGREKETLSALKDLYSQFNPAYAFDYKFLDQEYGQLYAAEQRVSTLSRYFAGLAILISCLGLFGLATHTSERRMKEIGIRKVLGASSLSIVQLLSTDFSKMVLVAIGVALPLSYWLGQKWLNNFAFSTDLEWWYFGIASLLALVIAWITVGLQTYKAARINPVKCLHDE